MGKRIKKQCKYRGKGKCTCNNNCEHPPFWDLAWADLLTSLRYKETS